MKSVVITIKDMAMVVGDLDPETEAAIDEVCRYEPEGTFFIKKRYPDYDGVHLYRHRIFPTGLLNRVKTTLESFHYHVAIDDGRHPPIPMIEPTSWPTDITLYDYQKEAIEKWLNSGRRGIIKLPTAGGKTLIALNIIHQLKETCLILVPGKDLLYQWHKNISRTLGVEPGLIGDGRCDIREITVATYQTIERSLGDDEFTRYIKNGWAMERDDTDVSKNRIEIADMLKRVGVLIVDEVHRAGAQTLLRCIIHTHCRYALGLSATPLDRPDNSNLAVIASCGEILYDIPMTDLISKGYLCPLEIRIRSTGGLDKINRDKEIKKIKDEMKRKKAALKDFRKVKDEQLLADERCALVGGEALKLWHEGRTVLVLATELRYGRKLAELLSAISGTTVPFVQGSMPSKKRKIVVNGLADGTIRLVVATSVFELGLDVPRLSGLVIASPSKSSIRTIQRVGRILRKHPAKKDSVLVDFDDTNASYFSSHFIERLKFYISEPGFRISYDGTSKAVLKLLNKDKDLAAFDMEWSRETTQTLK